VITIQKEKTMDQDKKELEYEKPTIQEEQEMIFPEEVWKQFSNGKWCFGCSNCNCN
jgi:hypothetical protein